MPLMRALSGPRTRPAAVAEQTGRFTWIFFVMFDESLVDNLDIITDMSNIEDGIVKRKRMRAQTQGRQG